MVAGQTGGTVLSRYPGTTQKPYIYNSDYDDDGDIIYFCLSCQPCPVLLVVTTRPVVQRVLRPVALWTPRSSALGFVWRDASVMMDRC